MISRHPSWEVNGDTDEEFVVGSVALLAGFLAMKEVH
jgi:hypothetical protein